MEMKLTTRPVILVTGSAKRTGLAILTEFANAGYDVAIQYRSSRAEADAAAIALAELGARTNVYHADLNRDGDLAALIDGVYRDFGRLDVLVNNAAIFFQDKFADFRIEDFDEAWRINCRAPILLTRAMYDHARRLGHQGAVINIVDQKVKGNFHPDHFSYTVAKTALGNLTNMLAVSCLPTLRVNGIFPGLMLPSDDQTQEDFDYAAKVSTPLGYAPGPVDLARTTLELAQARYNGTDIVLDAGQNLWRVDQDVIYKYRNPE